METSQHVVKSLSIYLNKIILIKKITNKTAEIVKIKNIIKIENIIKSINIIKFADIIKKRVIKKPRLSSNIKYIINF